MLKAISGAKLFDGWEIRQGVLVLEEGKVIGIADDCPEGANLIGVSGGIIAPGMIDLQVNGGGGKMVSGTSSAQDIKDICDVHARHGTLGLLPTLITDTKEATKHIVSVAVQIRGMQGFLGLHLEGPHLDPRKKGAHDAALIRPMSEDDCKLLCWAANELPALMVTVAPEAVTLAQISELTRAGAIVSLGHSDCSQAVAKAALAAGACAGTHLFNAMSQITGREPGLVGALLTSDARAGLIADGIHVHPETMKVALAAKPEGIFLVSDSMAAFGTDMADFTLGGRRILRRKGQLMLEDGTLAGADLTLPQAVQVLVHQADQPLSRALAMATRIPADLIGRSDLGRLQKGLAANFVHLSDDLRLQSVWRDGERLL